MGASYSTELGDASLAERLREELDVAVHRLNADDSEMLFLHAPNHGIGDEGVAQGAPALSATTHLKSLDLAYNGITAEGVRHLTAGMTNTAFGESILELRLSGNPIGVEGCRALCEWLTALGPRCTLRALYLYQCELDDDCILLLANALQTQKSLTTLNLDRNRFTRKTPIMLAQMFQHNHSVARLSFDSPYNTGTFPPATMEEIEEALARNKQIVDRREYIESVKQRKAQRREQADEQAKVARDAELADERRRVEAELSALEDQKRKEDEEVRALEAKMAAAVAHRQQKAANAQLDKQQALERAIQGAYEWRDKLTGHGTLQKEWHSGFTIMKTQPGQVGGTPSVDPAPPRLLQACFCDPDSGTAPFAKKLHYHCRYEDLSKQEEDVIRSHYSTNGNAGETGGNKGGSSTLRKTGNGLKDPYTACLGTGHICATVGFMGTKSRPDRSAPHFFASAHPGAAPVEDSR